MTTICSVVDLERLLEMLERRTRPNVIDFAYEKKKRAARNRPQVSGPDHEQVGRAGEDKQ